ncbi:MAG: hypothetical protein PVG90_12260 [Bacillota bacterium]
MAFACKDEYDGIVTGSNDCIGPDEEGVGVSVGVIVSNGVPDGVITGVIVGVITGVSVGDGEAVELGLPFNVKPVGLVLVPL